MKRAYIIFPVVVLMASLLAGCGQLAAPPTVSTTSPPTPTATSSPPPSPTATPSPPPTPTLTSPLAAIVDGQPISLDDYQRRVAQFEAALVAEGIDPASEEGQEELTRMRPQILEWMIEEVLIEQAAAQEGVAVPDEEVEAEVQRNIDLKGQEEFEAWLEANNFTLEDFRAQLHTQLLSAAMFEKITASVPERSEQVHARHILLEKEEEAQEVLRQLRGGGDFAALAKLYSQDEGTKESGGDLGFFPRGLMPPEVEEAAFALSPDQISEVIRSQFGFHIVQVLEKEDDRPLSAEMLHGLKEQTFRLWIKEKREAAAIERFIETE